MHFLFYVYRRENNFTLICTRPFGYNISDTTAWGAAIQIPK